MTSLNIALMFRSSISLIMLIVTEDGGKRRVLTWKRSLHLFKLFLFLSHLFQKLCFSSRPRFARTMKKTVLVVVLVVAVIVVVVNVFLVRVMIPIVTAIM